MRLGLFLWNWNFFEFCKEKYKNKKDRFKKNILFLPVLHLALVDKKSVEKIICEKLTRQNGRKGAEMNLCWEGFRTVAARSDAASLQHDFNPKVFQSGILIDKVPPESCSRHTRSWEVTKGSESYQHQPVSHQKRRQSGLRDFFGEAEVICCTGDAAIATGESGHSSVPTFSLSHPSALFFAQGSPPEGVVVAQEELSCHKNNYTCNRNNNHTIVPPLLLLELGLSFLVLLSQSSKLCNTCSQQFYYPHELSSPQPQQSATFPVLPANSILSLVVPHNHHRQPIDHQEPTYHCSTKTKFKPQSTFVDTNFITSSHRRTPISTKKTSRILFNKSAIFTQTIIIECSCPSTSLSSPLLSICIITRETTSSRSSSATHPSPSTTTNPTQLNTSIFLGDKISIWNITSKKNF